MIRRPQFLQFHNDGCRDLDRRLIRDPAALFLRVHPQKNGNRIESPRRVLGIKWNVKGAPSLSLRFLQGQSGDFDSPHRNTHPPTFLTETGSSPNPASVSSIM